MRISEMLLNVIVYYTYISDLNQIDKYITTDMHTMMYSMLCIYSKTLSNRPPPQIDHSSI